MYKINPHLARSRTHQIQMPEVPKIEIVAILKRVVNIRLKFFLVSEGFSLRCSHCRKKTSPQGVFVMALREDVVPCVVHLNRGERYVSVSTDH